MLDWNYIRENYPLAMREYMRADWDLEDFWRSYGVYVNCRIIEEESGEELWDWKINSKIIMYSSICYKTVVRDGKKIRVFSFTESLNEQMKKIFKLIEDQIKNKNYLNN